MAFDEYKEYEDLRRKHLLEGALGYMNELANAIGGDLKTLEDVNKKITKDFEEVATALTGYLRTDLVYAGFKYVSLFEEEEKPKASQTETDKTQAK